MSETNDDDQTGGITFVINSRTIHTYQIYGSELDELAWSISPTARRIARRIT